MGHTSDFFQSKKAWSILKDEILDYYLTPYISKILYTGKPLIIIDCFAGKGRFDDGERGSPLIIARHIEKIRADIKKRNRDISGIFIEKKYYKELEQNLLAAHNCRILSGAFEEHINSILDIDRSTNIFVYIDPYGVKCLDFSRFSRIKSKGFYTLEMLLNFNSVGFLREGCRLLICDNLKDEDDGDDYEIDEANNTANMDRIANGNYWRELVEAMRNNDLSMLEAEQIFMKRYTEQIQSLFAYVVNIPIKQKTKNIPKYRLIFGTNNQEGLLLMADNMHKKWQKILESQRGGQMVLFDDYEMPDLSVVPESTLEEDIVENLKNAGGSMLLKELIVKLILKYGVTFSESYYKKKIKEMPLRLTELGNPISSTDYKNHKILVSL